MNILEIVDIGLENKGYDGLYCPGLCACEKGDLSPGSCLSNDCKPGYKHTHTKDGTWWIIHATKSFVSDEEIESIINESS